MSTAGEGNKLLGLVREREQMLAGRDRDHGIAGAMHDEQRHIDARDAPVGTKLIPHQEPHRHDAQQRSARAISTVDVYGASRISLPILCSDGQRDRYAGAERKAPGDDPLRRRNAQS